MFGKSWCTYRPTPSDSNKCRKFLYKLVIIILSQWMYSCMNSDWLTESEYNMSKVLFQKYLDSSQNTSHMFIYSIYNIKDSVHINVIPHDNYFSFSRYFDLSYGSKISTVL